MDIEEAWASAIIALDANVLLNLYRYSPKAKAALKQALSRLRERIWVPFQAAEEFHRNRLNVLEKQTSAYADAAKESQKLLETLSSPHKHPFLGVDLQSRAEAMLSELATAFRQGETERSKLISRDPILDEIEELLDGRVGAEPSREAKADQSEKAKARLEQDVPPGTCDKKELKRLIGDPVLWLQLIEFAREAKKPVILVTDDAKEDWWVISRGQQIGPRPELVKEFWVEVGQPFYLYSAPRFIERAFQFLGIAPDEAAIESARTLSLERSTRRRVRERSEGGDYLVRLASHADKHRQPMRKFIDLVKSLSKETWANIDNPMKLDPAFSSELESVLQKCRCISRIAIDVTNVQAPAWNAYQDMMYRRAPKIGCELIVDLSRLPLQAIDVASALSQPKMTMGQLTEGE